MINRGHPENVVHIGHFDRRSRRPLYFPYKSSPRREKYSGIEFSVPSKFTNKNALSNFSERARKQKSACRQKLRDERMFKLINFDHWGCDLYGFTYLFY